MDLLIMLVVEILWPVAGELLIELGIGSSRESFRERTRAHPVVASVSAAFLGALVGALTSLVWPTRILDPGPVPGVSLFLSPIAAGIVMNQYGTWRERRGGTPSYLASFWGGAAFALGVALVRFLWVRA